MKLIVMPHIINYSYYNYYHSYYIWLTACWQHTQVDPKKPDWLRGALPNRS